MKHILLLLLSLLILVACEKEFTPETTFDKPEMVVEGYISVGQGALPPYVILTKSIEYSSTIGQDLLNGLFIHDATVSISDGVNTAQLQELCVSDLAALPSFLQTAIANAIGIPAEAFTGQSLDICVYVDLLGILSASGITPSIGGSYDLTIEAAGFEKVTAQTTIPITASLDSLWYNNHPNPTNDTLVEIYAHLSDPPNIENYYRLFSQRNSEPMYAASSRGTGGSVVDDNVFDGQGFEFNVTRGEDPLADFDSNTFGFFQKGDTITIRLSNLDFAHYRFWQTLENDNGGQGPFSTYSRIESNVSSGLGIWGGVSYIEKTIIVPK